MAALNLILILFNLILILFYRNDYIWAAAELDLDNHVQQTEFSLGRSQNATPERDGFVQLEEDNDQHRQTAQNETPQTNASET